MEAGIAAIKKRISSLSVNTEYEQSLLDNLTVDTAVETILVAGDQFSAVHMLLPTEEKPFLPEEFPAFPVTVEYGEVFRIKVVNAAKEIELYHTAGDFRHFCSGRLRELTQFTVQIPNPFLRDTRLIYFFLDDNLCQLNSAALGSSGCIVCLAADAGGLSDDYMELCRWLKDERCISNRVSMVLYQNGAFRNRMLPFMAESVLNRKKIGVFRCAKNNQDLLKPEKAIQAAVLDIQERKADNVADGVCAACCDSLKQKLEDALAEAKKDTETNEETAEKYRKALRTFQAMCVTERYAFSEILTKEEYENLTREIHEMFELLRIKLPAMVDEVVAKSDAVKADLKNLAGDYLGALIESYIGSLLDEITSGILNSRSRKEFDDLCNRFRRVMRDVELEYSEIEEQTKTAILRMGDINIGDFHTPLSGIIAPMLTFALCKVLSLFQLHLGFLARQAITEGFVMLTDAAMPKKAYARSVCKAIQGKLDELEQEISKQIQETILPCVSDTLLAEFDALVKLYSDQLQRRKEEYDKRYADTRQLARKLTEEQNMLHSIFESVSLAGNAEI